MTQRLLGAGLLAIAAATAGAAEQYPRAIEQAVKSGVKVVRSFPAASGLTGWVLAKDGQFSIVYTTADKKTLVAGTLFGEQGENLGARYEDQFIPKPDFAALYAQLDKAGFVVEGAQKNPKSTIYVFVDANCPFCHYTWSALQPYEKAGLQVRWLPVATLGPTSLPKAIEVMSAADQGAAFRRMEQNHGKPWTPSAAASESGHPAVVASIRRNGELMEKFGVAGTPAIVWIDKQGKVQLKAGMPRLSELAGITGLPEQVQTDPQLSRFK